MEPAEGYVAPVQPAVEVCARCKRETPLGRWARPQRLNVFVRAGLDIALCGRCMVRVAALRTLGAMLRSVKRGPRAAD